MHRPQHNTTSISQLPTTLTNPPTMLRTQIVSWKCASSHKRDANRTHKGHTHSRLLTAGPRRKNRASEQNCPPAAHGLERLHNRRAHIHRSPTCTPFAGRYRFTYAQQKPSSSVGPKFASLDGDGRQRTLRPRLRYGCCRRGFICCCDIVIIVRNVVVMVNLNELRLLAAARRELPRGENLLLEIFSHSRFLS